MNEDKPLTNKELRELLGYLYNDLPTDDEQLIKEARNTYLKMKRIHKDCISKQKVKEILLEFFGYSNPLVDIHILQVTDTLGGNGSKKERDKLKKQQDLFKKLGVDWNERTAKHKPIRR